MHISLTRQHFHIFYQKRFPKFFRRLFLNKIKKSGNFEIAKFLKIIASLFIQENREKSESLRSCLQLFAGGVCGVQNRELRVVRGLQKAQNSGTSRGLQPRPPTPVLRFELLQNLHPHQSSIKIVTPNIK